MGGFAFQMGASFLSVGGRRGAHGGASVLVGGGFEKNRKRGLAPTWETLKRIISQSKTISNFCSILKKQ